MCTGYIKTLSQLTTHSPHLTLFSLFLFQQIEILICQSIEIEMVLCSSLSTGNNYWNVIIIRWRLCQINNNNKKKNLSKFLKFIKHVISDCLCNIIIIVSIHYDSELISKSCNSINFRFRTTVNGSKWLRKNGSLRVWCQSYEFCAPARTKRYKNLKFSQKMCTYCYPLAITANRIWNLGHRAEIFSDTHKTGRTV